MSHASVCVECATLPHTSIFCARAIRDNIIVNASQARPSNVLSLLSLWALWIPSCSVVRFHTHASACLALGCIQVGPAARSMPVLEIPRGKKKRGLEMFCDVVYTNMHGVIVAQHNFYMNSPRAKTLSDELPKPVSICLVYNPIHAPRMSLIFKRVGRPRVACALECANIQHGIEIALRHTDKIKKELK